MTKVLKTWYMKGLGGVEAQNAKQAAQHFIPQKPYVSVWISGARRGAFTSKEARRFARAILRAADYADSMK